MPMHCCGPAAQEVTSLGLGVDGTLTIYAAALLAFLAMVARRLGASR